MTKRHKLSSLLSNLSSLFPVKSRKAIMKPSTDCSLLQPSLSAQLYNYYSSFVPKYHKKNFTLEIGFRLLISKIKSVNWKQRIKCCTAALNTGSRTFSVCYLSASPPPSHSLPSFSTPCSCTSYHFLCSLLSS